MTTRIDADLMIPGRGEPITNGTIIAEGDTITYAGPAAAAPETPDAEATVVPVALPGLWDAHGHLTGLTTPDVSRIVFESEIIRTARSVGDLRRTLDGGVTSMREVGGLGLDLEPAIAAGDVAGPTVYAAGDALSTTGGHGDIHNVPSDALAHLDHFGVLCDGVAEVTKAVRTNLRKNARIIKIMASGGVGSEVDHPLHQQFSGEELRAIVEEAARAERFVAAHCHGLPGIKAALEAGCRTIEHGSYLDEEAAAMMVAQGAILVPTRFIIDALFSHAEQMSRRSYEKLEMVADHHANAMKIAVTAGVRIAMGSDIYFSGDLHGTNSLEIKLLQDAGMTALEAIEAATANGPDTLGPQAPISGQLKDGYDADVIAIDFNPLEDNSDWGNPDRVTHVWQAGAIVKQPS